MESLPIEITQHILSYTNQYHMITTLVCKLWHSIVSASKPSGNVSIVFSDAACQGNVTFLEWILAQAYTWYVDSMEQVLRAYLYGKISRSDLMRLLYIRDHLMVSSKMKIGASLSVDIVTAVVQRRDTQLLEFFEGSEVLTLDNLLHLDVPSLQWVLDTIKYEPENLDDLEMLDFTNQQVLVCLLQRKFTITDDTFLQNMDLLSPRLLKHLLKSGNRIHNFWDLDERSSVWKDPRLLKKILRFHDWQCHKQILLKKCKDPAVERIVNDL